MTFGWYTSEENIHASELQKLNESVMDKLLKGSQKKNPGFDGIRMRASKILDQNANPYKNAHPLLGFDK